MKALNVGLVLMLIIACGLIIATGILAEQDGIDAVRKDAIAHGVAEWRVDQQTGETEFTWRECGGDKP